MISPFSSPHGHCLTVLNGAILLIPTDESFSADRIFSAYLLPFAVATATILFVIWRMHRNDVAKLSAELERARPGARA